MRIYTFDQLIGNQHCISILKTCITQGTLPHFTIFHGIGGTGKSTCAEITALAMTCQHTMNGSPCLECTSCKSNLDAIKSGTKSSTVAKINLGRENTKTDVDRMIKEIFTLQSSERNCVYILEEAHALSTALQTSLLEEIDRLDSKTYIILCTTKLNDLIPELRSRAVLFQFKRLTDKESRLLLDKYLQDNRISMEEEAKLAILNYTKGIPREIVTSTEFLSRNTKTLPLMVDFFNSGAAQVIMMLAKSGAGKTFSAFQIALSLIALDIHVSAIDIKGREWRKLLKFVDGVEINMDDENPRFVNTMRLDDFGCTRENCEYYFRMAVRATVNLLSIMVNLKPEEGNVTDLETILEQAVLKYFSQNNVDSKNPKTFVNTRRMKYADIIDIISDLATTKSYSEDQRELCSVIRTRCSTYFVTEGRYSKAFKNEITVAEVLRKPLVIYSFNKNADVMLDTMDTLRVFMVQYLDTKKQSIRKEQKLHTAAFYEELQRSNQFGKLVETISHAVTGSRSNNVMIFLLLNAVSVFNNNELNAIKSNITTKIVGKLEDGDIDLLVKEYGCKPIQKQLEKINDKSTNRWQNCFAILYDTGVDVDKAIYRTVVPQYMLEQFKTRDFNENIK